MIDYVRENPFGDDENSFLMNRSYKRCLTIELI